MKAGIIVILEIYDCWDSPKPRRTWMRLCNTEEVFCCLTTNLDHSVEIGLTIAHTGTLLSYSKCLNESFPVVRVGEWPMDVTPDCNVADLFQFQAWHSMIMTAINNNNIVTLSSLLVKDVPQAYILPERPSTFNQKSSFVNDKKYIIHDYSSNITDDHRYLKAMRGCPVAGNELPILLTRPVNPLIKEVRQ